MKTPRAKTPPSKPPAAVRRPPSDEPRLQRAIMQRIECIHTAIKAVTPGSSRRVTRASLARELEVSDSTVKRDLEALGYYFLAPLQFDFARGTYHYTDPAYELRVPILLESVEATAVAFAIRFCSALRSFPLASDLRAAFTKIEPSLGGAVSLRDGLAAFDAVVALPHEVPTEAESRYFGLLCAAIHHHRVVRMVYTKAEPGAQPGSRLIHPLKIVVRADGCLLVAHAPEARDRRNFDLARISHAELTDETFTPPAGFNLENYLAGGLDRFLGEPRHEAVIRYRPGYLAWVRVHRWHPVQTFDDQPDGSARSTLHVHHLPELVHFVLGAAGGAEVVSPPELRTMVRETAQALVNQHCDGQDAPL